MNHASLFSGIGGAELAASWLGWNNIFHCEINPFGRKVLEFYFPDSVSYADITTTDFTQWRGQIDILTGGFPCQPFSVAGSRKGATDDRYLWHEMLRAIRQIQPSWIVAENVNGILSMVQPGETVDMGRSDNLFEESHIYRTQQLYTLEQVCQDLESAGYSVQPIVIPACAVGAPHRRDRVWFVAHRTDSGVETVQQEWPDGVFSSVAAPHTDSLGRLQSCENLQSEKSKRKIIIGVSSESNVTNTKGVRLEDWNNREQQEWNPIQRLETFCLPTNWDNFPTQSPVRSRDDGLPTRLDGITFPKWRAESVKAYGNAWVPQVAYRIFKAIQSLNKQINSNLILNTEMVLLFVKYRVTDGINVTQKYEEIVRFGSESDITTEAIKKKLTYQPNGYYRQSRIIIDSIDRI